MTDFTTPKISVLVPIYNVDQYLKECLDSLISQTFTNFEVICINDGSMSRKTRAVCCRL